MTTARENELLALTKRLLDAIAEADWATYQELCDPALSAFEPEAKGQLIHGLDFHQYYFKLGGRGGPQQTTLASPHVLFLGEDVAVVAYVRLVQKQQDGVSTTVSMEETRVWHRQKGQWRHVHFHRSFPA